MQATEDRWLNFVGDNEFHSRFSFLDGLYDLFLLLRFELNGGDDLDVLLLVENFAVVDVDFNDVLELVKPIFGHSYLPASVRLLIRLTVVGW